MSAARHIDPPIRAKLLQVVVEASAQVHFPSAKIKVFGDGTFNHGTIQSQSGLTPEVSQSSQLFHFFFNFVFLYFYLYLKRH